MTVPRSAADPRPGNRPFYIDPSCPTCGAALLLFDRIINPDAPDEVWHDEWECPTCRDGLLMDWPESEWAEDRAAAAEGREALACGDVIADDDL